MATATQYYKLNEDTQLSTVQQLTAFSAVDYAWAGRTLTSWTDDVGQSHQIDGTVSFDRIHAKLSGQWMLDRHQVSASIPTGHGHVEINMENSEKPLATISDPWRKTVQLSNGQKATIWYDSRISVDCVPDDDYSAKFMFINNESKPVDSQYVHNGKTAAKDFKISSEFYLDIGKAGLSVQTINGNTYKFTYNEIEQPLKYNNASDSSNVQLPFNRQIELTNSLSIASLSDEHGIISAIGDNSFGNCKSLSSIYVPNVEYIGAYAFNNCESLSSINISNAISVGSDAFQNCKSLSSISIPFLSCIVASDVFYKCSNLKHVNLPNVKFINQVNAHERTFYECTSLLDVNLPQCSSIYGDDTFYDCRSLSSINISSLQEIKSGGSTFYNCKSLSTIYLPYLRGNIPGSMFNGCSSLISIDLAHAQLLNGAYIFKDCSSLTCVIGNELTTCNASNFENCINLSSIELSSVQWMRKQAFLNCPNLTTVKFQSLTKLGDNDDKSSFLRCNNLSSIYVNNSKWHSIENGYGIDNQIIVNDDENTIIYCVQGAINISNDTAVSVDQYAFADHCMLSSIDMPNISAIGRYAFSNATLCSISCPRTAYIAANAFKNGNGNFSLDLPNLTSLDSYAFLNNIGIAYANMPMLSNINRQTFDGCLNLSAVDAENAQTVDYQAFKNCSSLISVHFPYIVRFPGSSDNGVFQNCSRLVAVDCENVLSIGAYTFYNCVSLSSINCPNVKVIGLPNYNQAFVNCINLSSVHFEKLERIACDDATRIGPFMGCSQLSSADFPELTSNECVQSFGNCSALISADMPKLLYIRKNTFQNCISLKQANLHAISSIGSYTFQNCQSLELINMSANMEVPDVVYNAFSGITHPVNVGIPYEKLEEYRANETWAQLEDDGKVIFVTTDPTAQLVQVDGSTVYLTGKNLISEITQSYKDTTVAATIGYIKDEQDE